MYIVHTQRYCTATGIQGVLRAPFLLLLRKPDDPALYACVRRVALRQFGHWMMGSANINGHWHTVSGAYGSDGLPMDVDKLPRDAVQVPPELHEAWNKGGGWNSAGSEAPAMREWAMKTFSEYRHGKDRVQRTKR